MPRAKMRAMGGSDMPGNVLARSSVFARVAEAITAQSAAPAAGQKPVRTGLIGSSIQASLSPDLHQKEGAELGLSYSYQLLDLDVLRLGPQDLPDILAAAEASGFAGLNVTHPCKQAIISFLDRLSEDARSLGAVNTVVFENGHATGHNTDWWGFAESFRRDMPGAALDAVVLFGAGGAGAAVAHALLTLGVRRLFIAETNRARRTFLCEALKARWGEDRVAETKDIGSAVNQASGIVNATPIGMAKYPGMPLEPSLLRPDLWVVDIIYFPLETGLLATARAMGCRTMGGGGMVVFQAAEAMRLFTGLQPDTHRMRGQFEQLTGTSP
jgi:shikimate dehydrogenase